MTTQQLATKILAIIHDADADIEQVTESRIWGILASALDAIEELCKEQVKEEVTHGSAK